MGTRIRNLGTLAVSIFVSAAFAQQSYQLDLTGVGDGAVADGVYVSPYQGTVSTYDGTQIYSGYMICDDFFTDSFLNVPWNATATNAGSLNGTEKFNGVTYSNPALGLATTTTQQDYNAVAWLADQLLMPSNLKSSAVQTNLSFAIWDIFDGLTTDPSGGAMNDIKAAFNAVQGGYVGSGWTVFTPSPSNASQEFLVKTPEPPEPAILCLDLLFTLAVIFLLRRYRVQA